MRASMESARTEAPAAAKRGGYAAERQESLLPTTCTCGRPVRLQTPLLPWHRRSNLAPCETCTRRSRVALRHSEPNWHWSQTMAKTLSCSWSRTQRGVRHARLDWGFSKTAGTPCFQHDHAIAWAERSVALPAKMRERVRSSRRDDGKPKSDAAERIIGRLAFDHDEQG